MLRRSAGFLDSCGRPLVRCPRFDARQKPCKPQLTHVNVIPHLPEARIDFVGMWRVSYTLSCGYNCCIAISEAKGHNPPPALQNRSEEVSPQTRCNPVARCNPVPMNARLR